MSETNHTTDREEWFRLPPNWWNRFKGLVRDKWKYTLENFFADVDVVSEKHLRRSKRSCTITQDSLRKLALGLGYGEDWRTLFEALGGDLNALPPPPPTPPGKAQGALALKGISLPPQKRPATQLSKDQIFSDCLIQISFLEARGTDEEMDVCFDLGFRRLKDHPNDVFLRAVLTWAVLRRGTPEQAIAFAYALADYLAAAPPSAKDASVEVDRRAWIRTIDKLRQREFEEPALVRSHMEDGLARAGLLQSLRYQGNHSELAARICAISKLRELPIAVRTILAVPHNRGDGDWVPAAIEIVHAWLDREHTSGVAYGFLLWLTGRQADPDAIPRVVERTYRWIEQNPKLDDPLVRWGMIWLAGMVDHHVEHVLNQTRTWLANPAFDNDRIVRISYLWLVGARGSSDQVASAIADTTKWLRGKAHRDDGCIRIAYLLWLVCRGQKRGHVTPDQLRMAIAETNRWLTAHDDKLVYVAVRLAESVEMSS